MQVCLGDNVMLRMLALVVHLVGEAMIRVNLLAC